MEKLSDILTDAEKKEIANLFKSSINRTHVILTSMEPYVTRLRELQDGDNSGLKALVDEITDEDTITLLEAVLVGLAEILKKHIGPELEQYVQFFTDEVGEIKPDETNERMH